MFHLNWKQLDAFRAVMETGSTVGAGNQLNLSQPAISRAIGLLEQDCGFALFVRAGTKLRPTHDANLLYKEVAPLFSQAQRLGAIIGRIARADYGELRIAGFPALAATILPTLCARFRARHPHVVVAVYGSGWRQVVDGLIASRIDIALTAQPVDHPVVESTLVCPVPLAAILPVGHPLAQAEIGIADLIDEPFIALDTDDGSQDPISAAFASVGAVPRIVMHATLATTACRLVAEGCGVSIVDRFVADAFRDQVIVKPICLPTHFMIWIARPRDEGARSAPSNAFCEQVFAELPGLTGDT